MSRHEIDMDMEWRAECKEQQILVYTASQFLTPSPPPKKKNPKGRYSSQVKNWSNRGIVSALLFCIPASVTSHCSNSCRSYILCIVYHVSYIVAK